MSVDLWPNFVLGIVRWHDLYDSAIMLINCNNGQYFCSVTAIRCEHFTIVEHIATIQIFSSPVQSLITILTSNKIWRTIDLMSV